METVFDKWARVVQDLPALIDQTERKPYHMERLIAHLEPFRHLRGKPTFETALSQVARACNISPDRVMDILKLDSLEDRWSAFQSDTYFDHIRTHEEEVYPKDGWLGDYLLCHQRMNVPLAYHFWSAVAVFSSFCRRNFVAEMGQYKNYPFMYVLLVGEPGKGKSTAIEHAADVLNRANARMELAGYNADPPRCSRVMVQYGRRTPEDWLHEMAISERTVQSSTGELVNVGKSESVGIIINDEVVDLVSNHSPGSSGARWIEILTSIYTRSSYPYKTRSGGRVLLDNLAVTALLGSTPEWIRDGCHDSLFGGGFTSRCMFIFREDSGRFYAETPPPDPVMKERLAKYLIGIFETPQIPMEITREAQEWQREWAEHSLESTPIEEKMRMYWARRGAHLWKLAIVLELASAGGPSYQIHASTLQQAYEILRAEERWLPVCYNEIAMGKNGRQIEKVYNVIRSDQGLTRSKLLRRCQGAVGSSRDLNEILSYLVSSGRVREFQGTTVGKGKPARRYEAVATEELERAVEDPDDF